MAPSLHHWVQPPCFQTSSIGTQTLLLSPGSASQAPTPLPWRPLHLHPHWGELGLISATTSLARLVVGQKCFFAKSREEEQTHRLCPRKLVKGHFLTGTPLVLLPCLSSSQWPKALTRCRETPGSLTKRWELRAPQVVGSHSRAET